MTDATWITWSVLGFSAFCIGIAKTGMPGIGILVIPLVAAVIPAKQSTGLVLPMLIMADIFAVTYYKRHAVWKHLFRTLPYAAFGVIIGFGLMTLVNDRQLRPIIGAIVLGMLLINYWRQSREDADYIIPDNRWFPAIIGVIAGITTMMANAAGPVMTIYLLAMRLPKENFIGTIAWYFFIINCFKVPFSAAQGLITPESLKVNLAMAPLIVAGALAGIKLARIIPEKAFMGAVQWLAAAGAASLFLR